jgi:hypothetical protein
MNGNSKSFCPRDMFEFIHHLIHECYDDYRLIPLALV